MTKSISNSCKTYCIEIQGLVQGVGFRPFIYKLADEMKLTGNVANRNDGVFIILNCTGIKLTEFINKIHQHAPPASVINSINFYEIPECNFSDFQILKSSSVSDNITDVSPDIAVCNDCLADMKTQENRINYPFINCTNCGPRFTIIEYLPYDRKNTTMKDFTMCKNCKDEYNHIQNRRFHAQPIACSECGPEYQLFINNTIIKDQVDILDKTSQLLKSGKILAIKGIGGFFIACDAFNENSVAKLRKLKNREAKPFAVMFADFDTLKEYAEVNEKEEKSLFSLKRPIVLLKEKNKTANSVNVGFDTVGAMLPYMPFHYLLFEKSGLKVIVLTSGNLSDEPIITDNNEAINTFGKIFDAVLTYNRHIHNRTDDSVVRIMNNKERVLRRSRGYAPVPVKTKFNVEGILAAGAELANCFCIGKGNQALLSQHIGDLKNFETYQFYTETIEKYKKLFRFEPLCIISDMHPHYASTRYAEESGLQHIKVQHHHAHIVSCMTEHRLNEKVIGIAFDGTGFGDDGNIWGSEFMICDLNNYERITHFEYIPLPGGDMVAHEPWRTAVSMLYRIYGLDFMNIELRFLKIVDKEKIKMLCTAIDKGINTPLSSGAGRVFDAVSALLNICPVSGFHAEAPMRLESIIDKNIREHYDFEFDKVISFKPAIMQIISDMQNNISPQVISTRFHNTVIEIVIQVVKKISAEYGIKIVVLSGGTFQNKYLTENIEILLSEEDFTVYSHSTIPANDGGIALGQLIVGNYRL